MTFAVEFIFNFILTVLLAFTVGYCWILNRRIKILQDSGSELAQLLKHFDESTARASESIIALQTASKKIGETIQNRIEKANFLIDDLTFLIERGGSIADNLEAGISVARQRDKIIDPSRAPRKENMSKPEPVTKSNQPAYEELEEPSAKTLASLQAMLDKIGTPSNEPPKKEPKLTSTVEKPRSQAEQELLQMIRRGQKA